MRGGEKRFKGRTRLIKRRRFDLDGSPRRKKIPAFLVQACPAPAEDITIDGRGSIHLHLQHTYVQYLPTVAARDPLNASSSSSQPTSGAGGTGPVKHGDSQGPVERSSPVQRGAPGNGTCGAGIAGFSQGRAYYRGLGNFFFFSLGLRAASFLWSCCSRFAGGVSGDSQ